MSAVNDVVGSPTDDESGEHVDDESDVDEAAPRRDVGQVRHPELVRTGRVEVALDEVCRTGPVRVGLRRLESTSTDRSLEAHFAHQTGHGAPSHVAAFATQLAPYLTHSVHVEVLFPHTPNLFSEFSVPLGPGREATRVLFSGFVLVVERSGDRQHPADRLDCIGSA